MGCKWNPEFAPASRMSIRAAAGVARFIRAIVASGGRFPVLGQLGITYRKQKKTLTIQKAADMIYIPN